MLKASTNVVGRNDNNGYHRTQTSTVKKSNSRRGKTVTTKLLIVPVT